mgnify:FL=1|tara:strand:- start:5552 stop:6139 length:588 start_codon:yes stop_codon:yes gene_type:complete
MKNNLIQTILFLALMSPVLSQESEIKSIEVDSKNNGTSIFLNSSKKVDLENVTAWYSSEWFYVTIYGSKSDSLKISSFENEQIKSVEVNNSEESTQLAFQLKHDIDSFEIDIPKRKTIRFLVSKSRTIDTMDIAENSFFQEDENVDEKIENYESNNLSIDNKLFIAIGFLISAADITNSSSFLAGTIISLLSIIL